MARTTANRIAVFGDTPAGGDPAVIDYNVPLPSAIEGRRLVFVNIPFAAAKPWRPAAPAAGPDLAARLPLTKAISFFKDALATQGCRLLTCELCSRWFYTQPSSLAGAADRFSKEGFNT